MKYFFIIICFLIFTFSFCQVKKSEKKHKNVEIKNTSVNNSDTKVVHHNDDIYPVTNGHPEISGDPDANLEIVATTHTISENYDENVIYNSAGIEVKPEYPGGYLAMNKFILSKYQFPEKNENNEIRNGKVFASFIVEKDGSITEIKILKSFNFNSGKQIENILKEMPSWLPGEQNGKKVRCYYTIPINIHENN